MLSNKDIFNTQNIEQEEINEEKEEDSIEEIIMTINEDEKLKINNNEKILETKTVINAKYLEVQGLEIKSQEKYSYIKTKVKNNSKKTIKKLILNIIIYDMENKEILEISTNIQEIKAGETEEAFGIVAKEIKNAYNYKVVKK